jgi:GNAT superfamily N-acetyltransferase
VDVRTPLELANDNAARYWLAQAEAYGWETLVRADRYAAVRRDQEDGEIHQVLLLRPPGDAGALRAELVALFREWDTRRLVLEDPYAVLDLAGYGCEAGLPMPVMGRQAGDAPRPARPAAGVAVDPVGEAALLAEAERVVVEGFPVPARMPWRAGTLFAPRLLDVPGWRAWLARWEGAPAGACVTFDDGAAVGVYWVCVLPEHRSRGIGRALVEAALAAHPQRTAVLTATLLGEPLYRKAGFAELSVARWWRHPGLPRP